MHKDDVGNISLHTQHSAWAVRDGIGLRPHRRRFRQAGKRGGREVGRQDRLRVADGVNRRRPSIICGSSRRQPLERQWTAADGIGSPAGGWIGLGSSPTGTSPPIRAGRRAAATAAEQHSCVGMLWARQTDDPSPPSSTILPRYITPT